MSETPILDLEADPPKSRRNWLAVAIGAVLGLALMNRIVLDPLWSLPILYISIAIHEVGHLLAAKLVGMEPGGIVVGGLMFLRSGNRWIWQFRIANLLQGGIANPLPRKGAFDRRQYVWMVGGGPLATLLLALIADLWYRHSPAPPDWLPTLWWINVLLLLSACMPAGGANLSDFPRIWLLLRQPAEARAWMALLQLKAEDTVGILPRDWDADLVALTLQANPANRDQAYRRMLFFYHSIDVDDAAGALLHLEKALASSGRSGPAIQQWCFLEAAACSALLRADPASARTWLQRAIALRRPESTRSIEASIAQAERRYSDAVPLWDEALAYIARQQRDSGLVRFARAKIAEYRQQCLQAVTGFADSAASHQMHHQGNHSHDQQKVNQPAGNVEGKKPQHPQNEQNNEQR